MATGAPKLERLHGLDALRASMMLLGVFFHAAIPYTAVMSRTAWFYQDTQNHLGFDIFAAWSHLFRMPVFFLVAGFFGGLLLDREGVVGLAKNRAQRILAPLVLGWFALVPAMLFAVVYAISQTSRRTPFISPMREGPAGIDLMHLWFLHHLLIFYTFVLIPLEWLWRQNQLRRAMRTVSDLLIGSRVGPIIMGLITVATLLPMKQPGFDTWTSLSPPLRILAAYAVFFTFGWLVYKCVDRIDTFARRGWSNSSIGLAGSAVFIATIMQSRGDNSTMVAIAAGFTVWFTAYGLIGLFLRYASGPNPTIRYIADASYWIYLVHMPLTILLSAMLAHTPINALAKYLLVVAGTSAIALFTYDCVVRATFVGALLNGRRYPRAMRIVRTEKSLTSF